MDRKFYLNRYDLCTRNRSWNIYYAIKDQINILFNEIKQLFVSCYTNKDRLSNVLNIEIKNNYVNFLI